MTRPIKFRAYDKANREMVEVISIDFIEKEVELEYKNGDTTIRSIASVEIMEFSGLLDKFGKEIWEGDVVDADINGENKELCRRIVLWKFAGFYFEIGHGDYMPIHKYKIEVIGNIYEHENLIK